MHFVGPDQLHGFEERLTTDIYPADFGWTPDYRKPGERIDWWYHNLGSVTGAGVAEITNQMEYDDEVAFLATQKLYDLARALGRAGRAALVPDGLLHAIRTTPMSRAANTGTSTRIARRSTRRSASSRYDEQDPHSQRLYRGQRLHELRHHARAGAPLAARLFRQHLLSRRQGRRAASPCSNARACSTTRSSCSAPTMATCSASAACGSRCASSRARRACR